MTSPGRWAVRSFGVALASLVCASLVPTANAVSLPLRELCSSDVIGSQTFGALIDLPAAADGPRPVVGDATAGGDGLAVITIPRSLADEVRKFGDPTMRITGQVFGQIHEGTGTSGPLVKELVWEANGSGAVGTSGAFLVELALTTKSTFTPQAAGRHTLAAGTMLLRLDNGAFAAPVDVVCVDDGSQAATIDTFEVTGSAVTAPSTPPPTAESESSTSSATAPAVPTGSPPAVVQTDWAAPAFGLALPRAAAPLVAPTGAGTAPPDLPVRILARSATEVIADAALVPTTAGADGTWSPPAGQVGWYAVPGWVAPGSPGTSVLAGHVGSTAGGPDVFARVPELIPGDTIVVTTGSGVARPFVVTRSGPMTKADVPADPEIWASSSSAQLRLITCDPGTALVAGHYAGNWVVWARPL